MIIKMHLALQAIIGMPNGNKENKDNKNYKNENVDK
jgi:hypothetical protein